MLLSVNGIRLHYQVTGEGPDLIMVHGNGEDMGVFDPAVEMLSRRYTVHRVDSRGHGMSQESSAYHYDDMVEDMRGVIRALGLRRPLFYGFSDGGIVGLLLASRYPDLLSGLIVSGANTDPSTLKGMGMCRFKNIFRRDPRVRMMLEEPHITAEDLGRITVPTLVTAGENDAVERSDTEFIARSIPGAKLLILPGHDHGSYIYGSSEIAGIIRDWHLGQGRFADTE